jgi:alkylation response protein AidB-like acyl-CoA dehydrogenase
VSTAQDTYGETEDGRAVMLDSAHRFLSSVADPRIAEAERTGDFPWSIWPEVAAFGYIGIRLPAAVGGQELGFADLAVLMEAAGYHWLGLRALLNVHNMVAGVLGRHGTAEQKQSHLGPLLRGEKRVWVRAEHRIGRQGGPDHGPASRREFRRIRNKAVDHERRRQFRDTACAHPLRER